MNRSMRPRFIVLLVNAVAEAQGRALVLFAHGAGYALAYQGKEIIHEFVLEAGGSLQEFNLEGVAAYAVPADGLYVGTLALVPGGLLVNDLRPVTQEEWKAHRAGEWPWESVA